MSRVESRLTFRESLRNHWVFLLGPALFGPCALAGDLYRIPHAVIAFLFLAMVLPALIPFVFLRAPFRYWLLAGGVFMGSGLISGLCYHALK
jgi:hypothetical protein